MNADDVAGEIAADGRVPKPLADELLSAFMTLRTDAGTGTLGRSAPGQFVESFVQILECLAGRQPSKKVAVDASLRALESDTRLDEGLRLCGTRVALAMYALRSHRSITHKGAIDPNGYDLNFLYAGAQWCLAELLRVRSGSPMSQTGRLVQEVVAPLSLIVEQFDGRRLVLDKEMNAREEILVFLHSHYPNAVSSKEIKKSVDRHSPKTIENNLPLLYSERAVQRVDGGYKLTRDGFQIASRLVAASLDRRAS